MPYVTHLECALCGKHYKAGEVHQVCTEDQRPLWVRYDLEEVKRQVQKADLAKRPQSLWRYWELLPLASRESMVSLGETMTPLVQTSRLGAEYGMEDLWVKDESRLPTGSFKARGMAMAISMAKELGIDDVAVPTAGNAGGAMAFYAARAGMKATVFMPEDTPVINQKECWTAGAGTYLVNGLIDDCGKLVGEGAKATGWFNLSTLKEPYRIEGKKTMGLELAEQLDWKLPDAILYPTGGGTGLIGMWKAFQELKALGWLESETFPRMYSCQSDGCDPIATAFRKGERFATKHENAATVASGLRVPAAVGDFMILDAVRESGGAALSGAEGSIEPWMRRATSLEGLAICPETAICLEVLQGLRKSGEIQPGERVVLFNTGAQQKYPEAVREQLHHYDLSQAPDWSRF